MEEEEKEQKKKEEEEEEEEVRLTIRAAHTIFPCLHFRTLCKEHKRKTLRPVQVYQFLWTSVHSTANLPLFTPWVKTQLHSSLTRHHNEVSSQISRPGSFTTRKTAPRFPRASMGTLEKAEIACSCHKLNHDSYVILSLA